MVTTNSFDDLFRQLQEMEATGKVNLSIVNTIDKLIDSCAVTENFWRDDEQVKIQQSFLLYHASRNSRIILKKMKKRFIEAAEKHENPSVVHDSIHVLPQLNELYTMLSSLTKQTPSKQLVDNVSEKVDYLRDTAYLNNMLPTPEEEMEELDQRHVKKRFGEFAGTLQAMYG
jgi:hypothetical protein